MVLCVKTSELCLFWTRFEITVAALPPDAYVSHWGSLGLTSAEVTGQEVCETG